MTTKEEWNFRAAYLRTYAKTLRDRAHNLMLDAERYDQLANDAERVGAQEVKGSAK